MSADLLAERELLMSAMTAAASEHATDDHDASGRFAKGNRGGPGNPHARQVAALRREFMKVYTPERINRLAEALYGLAVIGSLPAIRLAFEYTVGKPVKTVDPDVVEAEPAAPAEKPPAPPSQADKRRKEKRRAKRAARRRAREEKLADKQRKLVEQRLDDWLEGVLADRDAEDDSEDIDIVDPPPTRSERPASPSPNGHSANGGASGPEPPG
jgi:hypothetical protein